MKIRAGSVLLSPGSDLVTAVQDSFGPCYYAMRQRVAPGFIYKTNITHARDDGRAVGAEGVSPHHYRVIAPVHGQTVRALLRKIGRGKMRLCPGRYWYEVIGD